MKKSENEKEVLVIDDNDITSSMIEAILGDAGFRVQVCADGTSALKWASARCFSAYIIDYHIPKVNGDVLAAVFRKVCPAAIIIGCSIIPKEQTFLQAGANYFIMKNDLVSHLLPTLTDALSSKE